MCVLCGWVKYFCVGVVAAAAAAAANDDGDDDDDDDDVLVSCAQQRLNRSHDT